VESDVRVSDGIKLALNLDYSKRILHRLTQRRKMTVASLMTTELAPATPRRYMTISLAVSDEKGSKQLTKGKKINAFYSLSYNMRGFPSMVQLKIKYEKE
jgi:hypothetical protein